MKLDAKGNYIAGPATMYQNLRCTNDSRGAAREVYVFYNAQGGIVAVEPERGAWAAWDMTRKLVQLPSIETYPAERRALLKEWPTLKQAMAPTLSPDEVETRD